MTGSARWRLAGIGVCVLVAALGGVFLFARDSVTSTFRFADRQLVRVGNESPATDARPDAVEPIAERDGLASAERSPLAGLHISGLLVSGDGKPLRNVRVRAYRANGDRLADAKSRSDGGVTVRNLPHDEAVFLRVEEDRYWSVPESPEDGRFDLAGVDVTGIQIVLGRGATISGIVEWTNGTPIPAAEIFVRRSDDLKQVERVARADEQGLFKSRAISPGNYEFVFERGDGEISSTAEPQRIHIENEKPLTGIRVVYPESAQFAQMISGVVTDSFGAAVLGAEVWSDKDSHRIAVTDKQGKYFANLRQPVHELVARHRYYSDSAPQKVNLGEVHLNFMLPLPATVEGQVIDALSGRPVRDYRVRVGRGNSSDEDFALVHDDDGRFSVKHVQAGSASVAVVSRGYVDTFLGIGQVAPGEIRRGVQVRLAVGAEIEGRVLDSSGAAVRLARVHFEPMGGQQVLIDRRATDTTGDDGYFYLQSVPTGAIRFVAEHESYRTSSVTFNVVPGGTSDLRITLDTGATLRGRVTVGGRPVGGNASGGPGPRGTSHATIGSDGRFAMRGLLYGTNEIRIRVGQDETEMSAVRHIEIREGESPEIQVSLPALTSRIQGEVYPIRGNTIDDQSSLLILCQSDEGDLIQMQGAVKPDGRFDLRTPSGAVRVGVESGGRCMKYVTVHVSEETTVRQEIHLDTGSTVYVDVGEPPVKQGAGIQIFLLQGIVEIKEVTDDLVMATWKTLAAATLANTEGQATLTAIDSGTYTVVAVVYGMDHENWTRTYGHWDSKVLEIGSEDEVVELDVSE